MPTMTTDLPAPNEYSVPATIRGLSLVASGQFEWTEAAGKEASPDEVRIEVAGCGVCHTDIAFAYEGIPTRHALPLVLGHEIAGRVVLAGERAKNWLGRAVIVPAVIPCGTCDACCHGRPTICRQQFMPGNDSDGGFASEVRVPAHGVHIAAARGGAVVTVEVEFVRLRQRLAEGARRSEELIAEIAPWAAREATKAGQ